MNEIELTNRIIELREKGYGYKRISKEVGISPSAVRHICTKDDEKLLHGKCKNCNCSIKSLKGKKKKIFCSDKCRMQWWNNNQNEVNKKAYYNYTCKECNKAFEVYGNSNRTYCSQICYLNSKRKIGVTDNE